MRILLLSYFIWMGFISSAIAQDSVTFTLENPTVKSIPFHTQLSNFLPTFN